MMTDLIVTILGCFTLCSALSEEMLQSSPLLITQVGTDVSLTCFFTKGHIRSVIWFKQVIGEKPVTIVSSFHHTQPVFFASGFDKNKRLSATRVIDSFNLNIFNTEKSDSATYYCATADTHKIAFGNGTFLVIIDADHQKNAILQDPVPVSVQPAGNLTLQCKIHSSICVGEHSVYWFRHGSGESHPGVIYTHGGRRDQCEKSSEAGSPPQSCVYNLPKRNLSLSDAGTYYCAVAACGQILFGGGTKVDIKACSDSAVPGTQSVIYGLAVLLFLSLTAHIVICVRTRRKQPEDFTGPPVHLQDENDSRECREQFPDDPDLNYAAIKFPGTGRRAESKRKDEETVYYGVQQQVKC